MDIIRRKPNNTPRNNPINSRHGLPVSKPNPFAQETLYVKQTDFAKKTRTEKKYQKGLKIKRFFKYLFWVILFFFIFSGSFLAWKTYAISKKINIDPQKETSFSSDMRSVFSAALPSKERTKLDGENDGRINILLLGEAGEKNPGKNLTDTIMVMSIDTKNKKVAMLSLPRDFYVKIPNSSIYTKINGLYQNGLSQNQGVSQIKDTVQDITGINIQYYLVANFDGFKKLIDDIGGINVTVERDIFDSRYPGPNYSYQTFEIKKGFHNLDGETALKYVRERHDDPEGDFGRAKRQQQVIQAVKNKLFSAQTMLNVIALNNLLNTLGDNIKTNISFDEIESFLALIKEVDTQNINNVVVDAWKKDSLMKVSHVQVGNVRAFILIPRIGSYSEIQDLAKNIFDQDALKKRQAQIENENASISLINQSSDPSLANKMRQLLTEKLGFKNVKIVSSKTKDPLDKTVVLNLNGNDKIYSLDELIKKIPAELIENNQLVENANNADTDFAIILGNDAAENYKYEEDSIEEYNKSQDDNNLEL